MPGPEHHHSAGRNHLILMIGAVLLIGCTSAPSAPPLDTLAEVPEIRPGLLAGYLPLDAMPDSLALLPPPPTPDSAAMALDQDVNASARTLHGSARWALAAEDAHLGFPGAAGTFSCALGAPVTEADTPNLYRLLRRTLVDAGLATYGAKTHYARTRPFVVNGAPTCSPEDEATLRQDGSYPSGHTAAGWAWALVLAELAPAQSDAVLARGLAFGQSRMICNVHWQSDVIAGRIIGAAAVARLHTDPLFQATLAAARTELAEVRSRGLSPTRDCDAEAAALAQVPEQASWPASR